MKRQNLQKKTKNLLLLSRKTLEKLEPTENNLMGNIKYWQKQGGLIALKKGLYVLREKYEKETQKDLYLEYIACQLVQPSCLSLEYVMGKYGLLSEPVYSFTLITTKRTKAMQNKLGTFRYYSIAPNLFSGHNIKYFYGASILEATKAKAIFDFIYFKFLRNQPINKKAIEDLRVNWGEVGFDEWAAVKKYGAICKSKKVGQTLDLIEKKYFPK